MNVEDLIGSFRRHWRIAAAIFFLSVLVAGYYAFSRPETNTKRAYQASSRFRIPADNTTTGKAAPSNVPDVLLNSALTMALADPTIAQAQAQSGIAEPEQVAYKATLSEEGDVITLETVGRTAKRADKSLLAYNEAFTDARTKAVVADATKEQRGITVRLAQLASRQKQLENQLNRYVDPLPELVLVNQNGQKSSSNGSGEGGPPVLDLPEECTEQCRLLASERNSIYSERIRLEAVYGSLSIQILTPDAFADLIALNKAGRVIPKPDSIVFPLLIILGAGAILGLAAALLADYFDSTIHTARSANTALGAPILAKIPARHRFEDRFADPTKGSERAAAYRGLAATSLATDRLPKALLVTSPADTTQDGLAYNYANGLTLLGMKVALIATEPSQAWFLEPQEHGGTAVATLPELLDLAHRGALGTDLMTRVALSAGAPNLVVVPPGTEDVHLSLDGLSPLLDAFEAQGIDVVVVAGPQMLEDADATIFAYTIRNVLWCVETHAVKERDARAAADHLELTGGTPFGVALIGEEI